MFRRMFNLYLLSILYLHFGRLSRRNCLSAVPGLSVLHHWHGFCVLKAKNSEVWPVEIPVMDVGTTVVRFFSARFGVAGEWGSFLFTIHASHVFWTFDAFFNPTKTTFLVEMDAAAPEEAEQMSVRLVLERTVQRSRFSSTLGFSVGQITEMTSNYVVSLVGFISGSVQLYCFFNFVIFCWLHRPITVELHLHFFNSLFF